MTAEYAFCITDSLEKILPGGQPRPMTGNVLRVWPGETVSFQVAARVVKCLPYQPGKLFLSLEGPAAGRFTVRHVELMPVLMATQCGGDDDYLSRTAAMIPDILLRVSASSSAAERKLTE